MITNHRKFIAFGVLSALLFWLSWPTVSFSILLFFAFVPLLIIEKELRTSREIRSSDIYLDTLSFHFSYGI